MQDGGEGRIGEYVGGYSDWLRQGPSRIPQSQASREQTATTQAEVAPKPAAEAAADAAPAKDKRKLGFKQARELEAPGAHRSAGNADRRADRGDERPGL